MGSTTTNNAFTRLYLSLILLSSTILAGCRPNADTAGDGIEVNDTWYRNAVIYNLDVDAFKDSDGDGIGDFKGLIQKLGYLDTLGVDVIWLSPFQPSPDGDDGYDITDYYGIDNRLGTQQDFKSFISAAKARGIKVIMDIVLNHTSIEHPWFAAARADTNSKFHDWYVWSDKKPKDADEGMVFPGVQTETWSYDDITKSYYFHRFYDFQPDLNYENKEVQKMAKLVLDYWLKQGLDGFRLDAVPFIIDKPKTGAKDPDHLFEILTDLAAEVKKNNAQAILLGEANVTAEENIDYFGKEGERLQMMFNFFANQHLFYSLAKNDPTAFGKALEDFKKKPGKSQWAFFLRNHDEVDLARLTKVQRKLVFDKFGPESNMQLYERGIRRRLAPMLSDSALIRMSYNLLFSLPGAPVIRYGEEIGMGDDLTLRERLSVRTPMQWDNTEMAGFSSATKTFRPVINMGDYSYSTVNVATESANKNSLLVFLKEMIALRKQHPEIGLGTWEILNTGNKKVLLIDHIYKNKHLLTAHNFGKDTEKFSLPETLSTHHFIPLIRAGNEANPKNTLQLDAYGFQWYVSAF